MAPNKNLTSARLADGKLTVQGISQQSGDGGMCVARYVLLQQGGKSHGGSAPTDAADWATPPFDAPGFVADKDAVALATETYIKDEMFITFTWGQTIKVVAG